MNTLGDLTKFLGPLYHISESDGEKKKISISHKSHTITIELCVPNNTEFPSLHIYEENHPENPIINSVDEFKSLSRNDLDRLFDHLSQPISPLQNILHENISGIPNDKDPPFQTYSSNTFHNNVKKFIPQGGLIGPNHPDFGDINPFAQQRSRPSQPFPPSIHFDPITPFNQFGDPDPDHQFPPGNFGSFHKPWM